MAIDFMKHVGWLCLLVFLQVMVLSQVQVLGYAVPLLYIYLLLVLKSGTSRVALLLWGFVLGFAVDFFSSTMGMHAAATTLLAFLRPSLLRLFAPRDSGGELRPGIRSMGFWRFFRYLLTGALVHHLFLFLLESFSFFNWTYLLLATFTSALFSTLCMLATDAIGRK